MADTKISALTASTTPLAGTEVLPIVQSGTTKQVSVANLTAGRAVATGALTATGAISATTSITSGNGLVASGSTVPASGTNAELGYNGTSVYFRGYDRTGGAYKTVIINEGLSIAGGSAGDVTLFANNLVIGTSGNGIDFSATPGTGTSELLADYEEGTWTPTLTPTTSGSITLNTSIDTMRYTKIGSVVSVQGRVQVASVSSPLGAIRFSLPFAVADLAENAGIVYLTCTMDGVASANVADFVSETSEGNSYTTIYLGSASTWQGVSAQQVQANTYVYLSGSYVAS